MNGVVFLLYDKKGRILLHHRDEHARIYPNEWSLFGGALEDKETPEQCTIREAKEELDYPMKHPQFLKTFIVENKEERHLFIEEYDGTTELQLNEGKDMAWYTSEETDKLKMSPQPRKELEYVKEIIRKRRENKH